MTDYAIQLSEGNEVDQANELDRRLQEVVIKKLGKLKNFTLPEIQAIVELEKYKMLHAMEVIPFLAKAKIASRLDKIWMNHPDKAGTKREFIEAQGIGYTTFYELVNIYDKVIPFLDSVGIDSVKFFREYSPSNIREILPAIKALFGEPSQRESVNKRIQQLEAEILDVNPKATKQDIVELTVGRILEEAKGSNTNLRKFLDPDPTEEIVLAATRVNGRSVVIGILTDEQLDMLRVLMKHHLSIMPMTSSDVRTTPAYKAIEGRSNGR